MTAPYFTLAENSIPIVDLSPITANAAAEAKQAAAAALLKAAKVGVFYLKGHGVESSTISQQLKYTDLFHSLPEDEKNEIHLLTGGTSWRGYMPKGGEGAHGTIDHKRSLYLGNEHGAEDPNAGTPTFGANRFLPDEKVPGMKEHTLGYIEAVTELGQQVMSGLMLAMGLEENHFRESYTQPMPVVLPRLVQYDSEGADRSKDFGISAHSDFGFLTLLQVDDAGLQYELPTADDEVDKKWVDVPPLGDAFIVGIGDMLDRMTDGRIRSRFHRVLPPAEGKKRHSIPFFWDASWTSPVQQLLPARSDKTDAEKATDEARWSKTKLIKLTGIYAQYLAAKVQPVFPALIPEEALKFEGMKVPSSRFHIVPPTTK